MFIRIKKQRMLNMRKPDYEKLSSEKTFHWSVGASYYPLIELTGIPIKEFFLNPSAGIELFKKGIPLLKKIYEKDVNMPGLCTPPISYGHANCVGVELFFPDNGEVNHGTLADSLDECIRILKKPVDFINAGMIPFYLDYLKKMQAEFPGKNISFGFKAEGPLTTAYTFRKNDFFFDPYDSPDKTEKFLSLITDSIIEFQRFARKLFSQPLINPDASCLADDVAAMFSPSLWERFVLPFHRRFFEKLTTGKRAAHIEDLSREHLKFLEKTGIENYDPSVSAKLNPQIITDETRVPFSWRLCDFHYPNLTAEETADFVYKSAADGASGVFTIVGNKMCDPESVKKVYSFIEAAKRTEKLLKEGMPRKELLQFVSQKGMEKFWSDWP